MKNLISNTSFGKLLLTKHLSDKEVRDIRDNYDEFLSLLLEIWMFVPCDEDGNVLKEPKNYVTWLGLHESKGSTIGFTEHEKYQQAKERCLFEEWIFEYDFPGAIAIKNQEGRYFSFYKLDNKIHLNSESILHSIECLVGTDYNIQLSKTRQKQIGLE